MWKNVYGGHKNNKIVGVKSINFGRRLAFGLASINHKKLCFCDKMLAAERLGLRLKFMPNSGKEARGEPFYSFAAN